jgi:hypothetical protein
MATATVKKLTKNEQRTAKLKTALKELGSGKNKIAEALKAKRIKGDVGDSESCPIANYVKRVFPKAASIEVEGGTVDVCWGEDDCISVDTPKAVNDFISSFDESLYPDLIK